MPKLNIPDHRELTALKLNNAEKRADSPEIKHGLQQHSIEHYNEVDLRMINKKNSSIGLKLKHNPTFSLIDLPARGIGLHKPTTINFNPYSPEFTRQDHLMQ